MAIEQQDQQDNYYAVLLIVSHSGATNDPFPPSFTIHVRRPSCASSPTSRGRASPPHSSADMLRPSIVRADTIDLQDQRNPTAADHSRHPNPIANGLAPHQRAEVEQVQQDQRSEEQSLQEAWSTGENVEESGGGDGADDGGETESDGDDDMMDRISSSPSIDDGGSPQPSSPLPTIINNTTPLSQRQRASVWPPRTSSLSPSPRTPTPTKYATFNQSATPPARNTPSDDGSPSPSVLTPRHLPLHVSRTRGMASPLSPLSQEQSATKEESSSPLDDFASKRSLRGGGLAGFPSPVSRQAECHHGMGRYGPGVPPVRGENAGDHHEDDIAGIFEERCRQSQWRRENMEHSTSGITDTSDRDIAISQAIDSLSRPIESPYRLFPSNFSSRPQKGVEQSPSLTSIESVDLPNILLPVDDPLLDRSPSPTDSTDS